VRGGEFRERARHRFGHLAQQQLVRRRAHRRADHLAAAVDHTDPVVGARRRGAPPGRHDAEEHVVQHRFA
jgi:hypothetical protein